MSRETGRLTVLHISDVHATDGTLLYGTVDGFARLRAVSDYVRHAAITPEAVVITGDLAQRGHAAVYPALAEALMRLEDEIGVPVLTTLGNHDDPDAARILPGHAAGHHRVVLLDGLRIVLLDSASGELGPAQLAWLAAVISEPHGDGTIVALHHPPLGSPLPTLAKAGLRDAASLLGVIAGTDVRAVLCGHFHHPLTATLRGMPVFVGPSLAYHQVMDAGPDTVSGHDKAMFSLVHLLPQGVTATSVGLESPAPLFTSSLPS
ncbi:metallophosphoesterase family protein [Microbacterium sp. YJN-G]|uniref:metallophosphoesterase family protein n=1 Tax=Microbacterium sp. YJN-G TaxID=2763257 RepID=UPI001877C123|nr:metallophosphoesterase [Microbacterium sp. YJN-G]